MHKFHFLHFVQSPPPASCRPGGLGRPGTGMDCSEGVNGTRTTTAAGTASAATSTAAAAPASAAAAASKCST